MFAGARKTISGAVIAVAAALTSGQRAEANEDRAHDSAPVPVLTADPLRERNVERVFERVLAHVLESEGGLTWDRNDRGNRGGTATFRGVTQTAYEGFLASLSPARRAVYPATTAEIAELPEQQQVAICREFYRLCYWERGRCAALVEVSPGLAAAHFDAGVNHGVGGARRLLCTALGLSADSLTDSRIAEATREVGGVDAIDRYCASREDRYRRIVERSPSQEIYLDGWLKRNSRVRQFAISLEAGRGDAALRPIPERQDNPRSDTSEPGIQLEKISVLRASIGHKVLRLGDNDREAVKALQTLLNAALPNVHPVLNVDGDFGRRTEARVRVLQERVGKSVDGAFGPQSLEGLERLLANR